MIRNKPHRLAVVGAGLIGARHARLAASHSDWIVSALVDPDETKDSLAAELGCARYDSIGDVPEGIVDAAILATPNAHHLTGGLACVDRKWPCLIEKPIADTVESAQRLVSAFEKAGLPLLIGHHRRYHPFVGKTREVLQTHEYGAPVFVSAIWAVRKPDSYFDAGKWRLNADGGPILINLIHEIDLLLCLFGPVCEVLAMTSNAQRKLSIEDSAAIVLRFESGVLGTIALSDAALTPWSFEGASGENPNIAETGLSSWRIGFTKGAIEFPVLSVWQDAEGGEGDWSRPLMRHELSCERLVPLHSQLSHFAALVSGETKTPVVSGEDGLEALKTISAIQRAAQTGQTVSLNKSH